MTESTQSEAERNRGKIKESLSFPAFSEDKKKVFRYCPQGGMNSPAGSLEKGESDTSALHNPVQFPLIDADLQRLIDAWPTLPVALRAGILAMIDAAKKS